MAPRTSKALGKPIGKDLPQLPGAPSKRKVSPQTSKSSQVKFAAPKSLSYERIKIEVMAAIANLPRDKQNLIPAASTLPEAMIALALVQLNIPFQAQASELGGRLRVGGAVVDFIVMIGSVKTIIRCQGDYWHSQPDRRLKDIVQYDRLHRMHYRIWDAWEMDLYLAWTESRLKQFVQDGVSSAS